jgi:hypothetical protein
MRKQHRLADVGRHHDLVIQSLGEQDREPSLALQGDCV